ncbi:hypothetical protein Tco_0395531, partial [Tanacetum coccineum]
QSNFPNQTSVADKAPFIGVDVVHGGAAATISSIDAGETIRQEVEVPQSNFPNQTLVADEAPFIDVDVVHGGAATTVSSIDAG